MLNIVDLSSDRQAVAKAKHGYDVINLARFHWHVCVACDCWCEDRGGYSACCATPTRVQGWS